MPHLAVNEIHANYGKMAVLHGISFDVDRGEVVSLVGPSGSGKSTVLRALVGLTPVTSGSVEVDGTCIDYSAARAVKAARDRMAIVFQQYNLFQNMNVLRNVALAPTKVKGRKRKEVEEEAMELLALVGMDHKAHAYPDELSGGQQQRVAIARALALKPEILLLDEVTSALDPELVNEVLDAIRRLAGEGMTMLLVSHEMAFVREVSSKVVFMDQGKLVESGPPSQIFDNPDSDRARDFFGKVLRG
ncbi:amino acid ABC transporter ATP-binding protein (plasmid) [Antarctobacter heliothermus]|uniref:Amino acid ABC transporter ATP-binding protein n=1 Tax=Antarctobacter heliothermus TaxID=74033 RepID=A0A222EAW4_9RHOB|nr:amino acid ABC transporter ATP-binding protein [Antarctobacter heliothermus]ASP23250.1 amino acid ABC transporter ATP-binding protein [Antarctobacter heliothermus]MBT56613.1 amino acid ABC transporter ATP-binding protein [Mameliella sp.]